MTEISDNFSSHFEVDIVQSIVPVNNDYCYIKI
jgi:hypothetical protein